ncbi:hypothetical protein VOLCADRAFT_94793 [Volvox carteri f. nagariensis]|uniref:Uncharacterized protein n=1 Tax=Volvox carteri f. nagariensis TaxID=3068 RepID=D8U5S5_VOLCA|nr:uncharacterized protein VOLCADRAFT_94793 [Volvox carteri f. nagariensis]EFJ45051.1 hypothetical protein VOLCADRAFT_94793 [Volvox carteri f. nagariensis]|eukprot:XP_002954022.1 hypothetical protein VOLCADRAFT_94793 [Volvox carteri f. nagariensis]
MRASSSKAVIAPPRAPPVAVGPGLILYSAAGPEGLTPPHSSQQQYPQPHRQPPPDGNLGVSLFQDPGPKLPMPAAMAATARVLQSRQLQAIQRHAPPQHPPQVKTVALPSAQSMSKTSVPGVGPQAHLQTAIPSSDQTPSAGAEIHQQPEQQRQQRHAHHCATEISGPRVCSATNADNGSQGLQHKLGRLMLPQRQQQEGSPPQQKRQRQMESAAVRCTSTSQPAASPPLCPVLHGGVSLPVAAAVPSATKSSGRTSADPIAGSAPRSAKGSEAAERWALAQLYLPMEPHCSGRQGGGAAKSLQGVGTYPGSGVEDCTAPTASSEGARAGVAVTLFAAQRGVLKRCRAWGGELGAAAVNGSQPCQTTEPSARGAQCRQPSQLHERWKSACWADGQTLYTAAASALPVDCSFRSLRNTAVATTAAHATGTVAVGGGAGAAHQSHGVAEPDAAAGLVAAAVVTSGQGGGAEVIVGAALHRTLAAIPAGDSDGRDQRRRSNGQHCPDELPATQRYPGGGGDTSGDNATGAASLLDDPRNYETPELLAQLLYDNASRTAERGGTTAIGAAGQDAQHPASGAAPRSQPGATERNTGPANMGAWGSVAGAAAGIANGVGAGDVAAGGDDGNGSGSVRVPREQRLARLRALREEVAATEQLLKTLRRMVAEEEAALEASAPTVMAAAGGGGNRAGSLPPQAVVARQAQAAEASIHPHTHGWEQGPQMRAAGERNRGSAQRPLGADPSSVAGRGCGPYRGRSPELEHLPTQQWDSGLMLTERLDMLA